MFREAISEEAVANMTVVNLAKGEKAQRKIVESYKETFPRIKKDQFYFDGALKWVKENCPSS